MSESNLLFPILTATLNNVFSALFDAPILRIQQLLQTKDVNPAFNNLKPVKGAINCIYRIPKEEGAKYFWRGFTPLAISYCLRQVSESIHQIDINGIVSRQLDNNTINSIFTPKPSAENPESPPKINDNSTSTLTKDPPIGPSARLSIFIIVWGALQHPIDVIQVRMACNYMGKFLGDKATVRYTARDILRHEGIRGLYRGYLPLTLYSLLDKNVFVPIFNSVDSDSDLKMRGMLLSRDLLLYPLYVVSTRLMMQPGNPKARYNGMTDCFKQTYRSAGIIGLFRGFQITLAIYAVTSIINLAQEQGENGK